MNAQSLSNLVAATIDHDGTRLPDFASTTVMCSDLNAILSDFHRRAIFAAISDERKAQDEQWGGAERDRAHTPGDWAVYIAHQLARSSTASTAQEYRDRLVKIAALAVAALEVSQ